MRDATLELLALETAALVEAARRLQVPFVRQDRSYSCGSACLKAVLDYHGITLGEPQLARLLGTSPDEGTNARALDALAREFGLPTAYHHKTTAADLRRYLRADAPCLCAVQMHGGGHWVVVTGADPGAVAFMDPNAGHREMPAAEFFAAWHDEADGEVYDRFALAVGPPGVREGLEVFTLGGAVFLKIRELVADLFASGEVSGGEKAVQSVLDVFGVTPKSPQYADAVLRTTLMDMYHAAFTLELQQSELFPVWKYSNPNDSRSRPTHAARNGKYYPASVPFTEVRGTGPEDAINCRCVPIPVDQWEWAELKSGGARIAGGYPDVPMMAPAPSVGETGEAPLSP